MSNLCDKDLTNEEASCYLDRYPDLKDAFGDDLTKAKEHWKTYGCTPRESRIYECPTAKCKQNITDKQAHCYLDKYTDLKHAYGNNLEEAKKHWRQFGCTSRENRYIECDMKRNTEYNQDEAATNILKAYNKHHDDYERNVTQISTDQNHVYDVDGNMESTQLQLESAYMKYMGLTFGAIAIGIVSLKFLN